MSKRSELVLPPGTYAYSLDKANAKLSVLVGPVQNKLEEQEGAVIWDRQKGRPVGCPLERAVQPIVIVPADSYAIVTNPYAVDGKLQQPPAKRKTQVDEVDLQYGRTEHIPGPTAVIPWPGQDVQVRQRFQLARDQYIRVEVTEHLSDDASAWLSELLGDSAVTPGQQFTITGAQVTLFTPPTGVTVLGNKVQTAQNLGAFEWVRLRGTDGAARYVRGPGLIFPLAGEKVEATGAALDLTKAGVHIRRLIDADGPAGEELFLTRYGKNDGEPHYWWPSDDIELVAELEPIDIPVGGGIYVRQAGGGEVEIQRSNAPVLLDPLQWELVERGDSCYASAVVVQENEVVEINSPQGSRIIVGPSVELLGYTEQEGERLTLSQPVKLTTCHVDTADGVSVYAEVSFHQTLVGDVPGWFRSDSPRLRVGDAVGRLFRQAAHAVTALQVEADDRLLADAFKPEAFDGLGIEVSNIDVRVRFSDVTIQKAIAANRQTATMNRLEEQRRDIDQEREQAVQQHEAAMSEMSEGAAERARAVVLAQKQSELDAEKLTLEAKKAMQDLLDELATYELDRQARSNAQALDLRRREIELKKQEVEGQTAAMVDVLQAIQPQLIEAIRAAGVQTTFAKIVPSLGPSSILQGVGLQDALSKVVGSEAASALLLAGMTPADKPNGRAKRQAAAEA
jgi:hypothetical protein